MRTYFDFAGDTDTVAVCCYRCEGTGYVAFEWVLNGICFGCNGVGIVGRQDRAKAMKIQARRDRARELRQRKAIARIEAAAAARKAAHELWLSQNADLAAALRNSRSSNPSLIALRDEMEHGPLSEDQTRRVQEVLAEEAAMAMPEEGRRTVTGTVLTIKCQETMYGTSVKMLVKCDGYKLWGTCPASLDAERGDQVEMTATVSAKEVGFGFFARPTKARVLADA